MCKDVLVFTSWYVSDVPALDDAEREIWLCYLNQDTEKDRIYLIRYPELIGSQHVVGLESRVTRWIKEKA